MHATPLCRRKGFTMVELVVTLAVAAIVLGFGIPAFTGLMNRSRLAAATNTLVAHLQYARSEAIKRGHNWVAVGPYSSDDTWLTSKVWEGGYMVAVIASGDTPTVLKVLRRVDGAALKAFTIRTNNTVSPRVTFSPDGTSRVNATLTVCIRDREDNGRAVIVDNVGRVRSSEYQPGSAGSLVTCPPT